jgi:hypothetical protein
VDLVFLIQKVLVVLEFLSPRDLVDLVVLEFLTPKNLVDLVVPNLL